MAPPTRSRAPIGLSAAFADYPNVDNDVQKFHPTPPTATAVIVVEPMAGATEAAQLLDVMFAEPSGEWVGGFATPSITRYGSVNNLFINYS